LKRAKEVETEELHQEELETSGTAQTVKVSIITLPIVLETLGNESNQSSQRNYSIVTSSLVHTQSRNQGISMAYEMRLPIFRRDGSEDPN
jgi:hypothetical protein